MNRMPVTIPDEIADINGLRFVIVAPFKKAPFEKGWQDYANYSVGDSKLQKYLKEGYNYGILCGIRSGDSYPFVIDADDQIIVNRVREKLPETVSWKTQTQGHMAFLYMSKDEIKTRPLYNLNIKQTKGFLNIGHIRGRGSIEVGPGSVGENGRYDLDGRGPVSKVEEATIVNVFSEFFSGR
ncbi:MAG: bifunctional DNA primase/polymerase [Thermoplasmata archaeon]